MIDPTHQGGHREPNNSHPRRENLAAPRLGPATSGRSASASCSSANTWAGTSPSAKGGALAALIACWFAGLLYTCVAMIDSEVTSTVAAAGGQYAQAKHIVGPLMAFNVGLFLVFAYTMLEAANAITLGYLVQTVGSMAGFEGVHDKPFIVLTIVFLAWLNYRGVFATLTFNLVITAIAFIAIIMLFARWPGRSASPRLKPRSFHRPALWLARRHRVAALRPLVLPRHRRHDAGGRRSSFPGPRPAARHDDRHDHAAHCGHADLVHLRRSDAVGVSRPGGYAAVRCRATDGLAAADGVPVRRHHFSTLASANGCINDASRAWFSMGRDRYLPVWFGAVHPKYRTPYRSIVFLVPVALIFATSRRSIRSSRSRSCRGCSATPSCPST